MANRPEAKPQSLWPIAALAVIVVALGAYWATRRAPGKSLPIAAAKPVLAEAAPSPNEESPAAIEARRARDAMREQILAALRNRDAGVDGVSRKKRGEPPPPAAAPAEPPHGHYEAQYIQETFREDMFPMIKQCYESALVRKPELAGRLVLTFSIVGDPSVGGVVEDADFAEDSDLKDTDMETCVRESLMTLTFDKPPSGGGMVTVRYPILFSPGDEPPDDAGTD